MRAGRAGGGPVFFLKAAIIRARSAKILPTPGGSSCQRAQAFSPERHMVGAQRERHGIVHVGVNPGAEGEALAGSPRAAGLAARPLGDGVSVLAAPSGVAAAP